MDNPVFEEEYKIIEKLNYVNPVDSLHRIRSALKPIATCLSIGEKVPDTNNALILKPEALVRVLGVTASIFYRKYNFVAFAKVL